MIHGTLVGGDKLIVRIQSLHPAILGAVTRSVEALAIELSSKVKEEKLSGQVLKNRTGTLRRSINYKLWALTDAAKAQVGTNVEYARIHEFGGTIPRPNGNAIKMPERSFLRSALKEMEGRIKTKIENDAKTAMARAGL
jgi:phage gpG-like protein